jgi:hypothetical protein
MDGMILMAVKMETSNVTRCILIDPALRCAWYFGDEYPATNGGNYNVLVGGKQYLLQEMYNNVIQACEASG